MLDQTKNEPVLKPHVLQDALSDVAKERDIPQLLDSPIAQHFSNCQEVHSVPIVISVCGSYVSYPFTGNEPRSVNVPAAMPYLM